jgi:hypothetical protein
MLLWFAGTATICRTVKNWLRNSISAKSCGAAHASSPQREYGSQLKKLRQERQKNPP